MGNRSGAEKRSVTLSAREVEKESGLAGRPNGEAAVGQQSPHTKIVQGAMDTIARDKISGTRMREIARRSGISQGHLHYYFSAKSTLFLAVLDHLRETFAAERRAALHDTSLSPGDKLNVFFGQEIKLIRQCPDLLMVRLDFLVQGTSDEAIATKIREMYASWRHDIEEVVADGVKAGVFSADRAGVIPNLMIALMEGAFLQHINEEDSSDLEEYFASAHDMVLRLLAN